MLTRRGFMGALAGAAALRPGVAAGSPEPRRTLRTGVFVAGAGPAGFVAAIAANIRDTFGL